MKMNNLENLYINIIFEKKKLRIKLLHRKKLFHSLVASCFLSTFFFVLLLLISLFISYFVKYTKIHRSLYKNNKKTRKKFFIRNEKKT
jgi:hypothetical protein